MHKTIGIIGGLSPESTVSYYLHITRTYTEEFGDYHYPEMMIASVDLEQYHIWRSQGRWDAIAEHLALCAERLKAGGADFGAIATNTMHKVFHEAQAKTSLPLLSIFDPLVADIKQRKISRVGLLGTKYTMSDPFYSGALEEQGVSVIAPHEEQQVDIHRIIVEELVRGRLQDDSKSRYLAVMEDLRQRGAQGIILGCTEIPLLIQPEDTDMPLFDTAILHADALLRHAITKTP